MKSILMQIRMQKSVLLFLLLCACALNSVAEASVTERLVTHVEDTNEEGTLRVILQAACRTAGDDVITFAPLEKSSEFRIRLASAFGAFVIPQDCQGRVTLQGADDFAVVLDAAALSAGGYAVGDACTLNVYSDEHTVRGLHFVNANKGAGICLFGQNNTVAQNELQANRYGVVVSNVFQTEFPDMNGNGNTLQDNMISGNIHAGVLVVGATTENVQITRNLIFDNGGNNLDLGNDGLTLNDVDDSDNGANHLLNYADSFQAFPLVPGNDGHARYWGWGVSLQGARVEIFQAADSDRASGLFNGGADQFLGDVILDDMTFSIAPDDTVKLTPDKAVTMLTFDDAGNTSEFAMNVEVGDDADMDGVLDQYETGDGTPATLASAMNHNDSDGDGVPDGAEDRNRNGVWDADLGETAAYKADSDDDGVPDGFDESVLQGDADGDGLSDGDEDGNHNGIWEAYLGETSTHLADSDGDGVADNSDTCPVVSNPGQEAWYCQN